MQMSRFGGLDLRLTHIPGGKAILGTDNPVIGLDEEGPCRLKPVKPFRIMETAVTNQMFDKFVSETGYVTEAEEFGWSFVFQSNVAADQSDAASLPQANWWRRIDGASWRDINGPTAPDCWFPDHPVVQVSWRDALEFAEWAGGRLPTEAEWEHAARGGLGDVMFPWGDREPGDGEFQPCNIWQGEFPYKNLCLDGFAATAPAQSFNPNRYGLYNMVGNVWEWTSDPFRLRSLKRSSRQLAAQLRGAKILKGGSFLCHKSYCFRYRIAARGRNTPDSGAAHQGFRLVFGPESLE